jgi:hypothetical protein
VAEQAVRAAEVRRCAQAGELHRAREPQPRFLGRGGEVVVAVDDRAGQRDARLREVDVVAALGFQRHAVARLGGHPRRPRARGEHRRVGRHRSVAGPHAAHAAFAPVETRHLRAQHVAALGGEEFRQAPHPTARVHGVALVRQQRAGFEGGGQRGFQSADRRPVQLLQRAAADVAPQQEAAPRPCVGGRG